MIHNNGDVGDKYIKGVGKRSVFEKKLGNRIVECVACDHHCVLDPSQRGICGVRYNRNGHLYSLVNSMPCSIHIDPIEKKPLYHWNVGSRIFSVGTIGCNFRCSFCQNYQTAQAPKKGSLDIEEVVDRLRAQYFPAEEVVDVALKNRCSSIAFTYNEPTIMGDYVLEIAKIAKAKNMNTVLVTNGMQSIEFIKKVSPFIDAVNIDLKAFTNSFYSKICGARIKPVKRNIRIWFELGAHIEITTLLIPGENDSSEEIRNIAEFLCGISNDLVWHVSAFHDAFRMKNKGRTPKKTLQRAFDIGKEVGLHYIYLGNVTSSTGEGKCTFCPNKNCRRTVVQRGTWGRNGKIVGLNQKGNCISCNTRIPGIWTKDIQNPYTKRKSFEELDSSLYKVKLLEPMEIEEEKPVLKILYATQTGVSQELATRLGKEGIKAKKNYNIEVIDLEEFNEQELQKEEYIVIVTSTYFYGRIPRNGKRFLNYLRSLYKLKKTNIFNGLKFQTWGVGSSGTLPIHKKTYQVIAREIDRILFGLGAKRISKIFESNKRDNFETNASMFIKKFWERM